MSDTDISQLLRTTFYYHANIGGHIIQIHEQRMIRRYLRDSDPRMTQQMSSLGILEAALQ